MSYSSSTDDTDDETRMNELLKQRLIILRRQRDLNRQKNLNKKSLEIISTMLAEPLSSSTTKGKQKDQRNLKRRLSEFLKQQRNLASVQVELVRNKINKAQNKEEQKMDESSQIEVNEERPKVKVKKIRDPTQEKPNEPQNTKKLNDFHPLWQSPPKNPDDALDKNGNILKHIKPSQTKTLDLPKTKPIFDIEHIVEEFANEFKSSLINVLEKCANFVPQPYSAGNTVSCHDDAFKENQTSDTQATGERSTAHPNRSKNDGKTATHTVTQEANNLGTQESNALNILSNKEEYNDQLSQIQKEQRKENTVKENKKSVVGNDKEWKKHTETPEQSQNLEMGRRMCENAYNQSSEDEEPNKKKKTYPRNRKHTTVKEHILGADKYKTEMKIEESNPMIVDINELGIKIKPEKQIDKYISSLPQYSEYKTVAIVPTSWKAEPLSPRRENSKTKTTPEEIKSFTDIKPQSTNEDNGLASKDSHNVEELLDSETTKMVKTEESNNFKLSGLDISKEENKKENINEKRSNYQTLKKESQERIEKKDEFNEKLTQNQKHSEKTYKLSSFEESSSESEASDSSSSSSTSSSSTSSSSTSSSSTTTTSSSSSSGTATTKIVPKPIMQQTEKAVKDKICTEVSPKAEKGESKKTKRPLTPILIYHYYRPVSTPAREEETTIDSDEKHIKNLEAGHSSTAPKKWKGIGPKTPPPQDSSTSEDDIPENNPEESKSNKRSESFSQFENRQPILKQSSKEEGELEYYCQNIRKLINDTIDHKILHK